MAVAARPLARRPAGGQQSSHRGRRRRHFRRCLNFWLMPGRTICALCLLSGGGSALMPAPVEGVSLADNSR